MEQRNRLLHQLTEQVRVITEALQAVLDDPSPVNIQFGRYVLAKTKCLAKEMGNVQCKCR